MRPNILFVEDEDELRMTVGDRLRKRGYSVEFAVDGEDGLHKATSAAFDLIILDVMLPRRDGFRVCSEVRSAGLLKPILMLTARGQTADKVKGLRTGADDYLTKPFHMLELVARIEALLRRVPSADTPADVIKMGALQIDLLGTSVRRDGHVINLSPREFQLLQYFIANPGKTLSRDQLLREVWGYRTNIFTRTVDVHIASLRQKLEFDPKEPKLIVTVQRLGYKFTHPIDPPELHS